MLAEIGAIDAVLLSHDQHFDNLDRAGRTLLARVPQVITTAAGSRQIGNQAIGLLPWNNTELALSDGRVLQVTAAPARHGPVGIEPISGDVIDLTSRQ